jgi:hypothetical protein
MANVPSSPILVTLIMEARNSSETSILTKATWCNIPEDAILHSHCRISLLFLFPNFDLHYCDKAAICSFFLFICSSASLVALIQVSVKLVLGRNGIKRNISIPTSLNCNKALGCPGLKKIMQVHKVRWEGGGT